MKITLDHKALMALIERGGEEFELELRRGILKTALNKHLGLKSNDLLKQVLNLYSGIFDALVEKHIGIIKNGFHGRTATLNDEFKKRLEQEAVNVVNEIKRSLIEDVNGIMNKWRDELKKHYETEIDYVVNKWLNGHLNSYLDKEVERRLDAILKLREVAING